MKQKVKPVLKFEKLNDSTYLCYSKDHVYDMKVLPNNTIECTCFYAIHFLSTGIKKTYCKHINGLIELLEKENAEI